jgi:signal transduction histidine kinase
MKLLSLFVAWGLSILWPCAAAVSPLPSAPVLPAKVVWQYGLTSANDFPQRDPQDWRLLGSNDEGTHWTTLDVRKGELFPERQQRRIFKLASPAAFNVYRLQIDQVRDPASANSMHVAEIEPLGQSEDDLDPIPGLGDRITVQGENAPVESRFQAFDGRAETKWLDFASQNSGTRASWIQWQYLRRAEGVVTNVNQLLMLRARASQAYPVRIAGVLVNRLPGTNIFCFLDDTGYLEANCTNAPPFLPGQQVLVEGTSQWRDRRVGIAHCRLEAKGPAASGVPEHIAIEQSVRPDWELSWVETEGTVQFCIRLENRLMFELQDEDSTLSAHVLHLDPAASLPVRGSRVRVRGICSTCLNAKGERIVGTLWVPGLDAVSVLGTKASVESPGGLKPIDTTLQGAPLLTSIRQIRKLSPMELARGPRVEVHGVTTEVFGGYLQDDTAGIELWRDTHDPHQGDSPTLGTYVLVTGRGDWIEAHGPVIRVENIAPLAIGKLPKPERPSWAQLANGRMMDKWVEIEGVVRSTDGSHLLVVCEGGPVMATIRQAPASLVHGLVDATVRLRGVDIMATDDRGQFQGIQLAVPSLDYVEVERAAADAFSLPVRPIASLFQVSGPKGYTHRVKIEGVLTFCEQRRFFLQDKSGAAMAMAREEVMLDSPPAAYNWAFFQAREPNLARADGWKFGAGDVVQVVGFPENRAGYSPVLTEVLVRKLSSSSPERPVQAAVSDIVLGKLDSTLVSLEAVLLGSEAMGAHHMFQLEAGQWIFQAIMPEPDQKLKPIAPGSRVRVTGICQIDASPFPELGKRINSFKLLMESPAGFVILQRPPWWTPQRALVIAAVLIAGLALASAWIGMLRHQVEARTAQLEKEIEERKRIELEMELGQKKLLQASRLAGMAEVATNVLHNVGNVLNGANMLATLIGEQVRRSKISSLVKAVGLMTDHKDDLESFLTRDERGRHLPTLLRQLAAHLAEERNRLQGKVDALTESVQHIKQVVTMQQKYAKVSTVTETVSLPEVVEDALRLAGGALARHEIQVIKQFEPVPAMNIERHRVLQILFNLLENAKRACAESGRTDKQIILQIRAEPGGQVQIRVRDNGTGIAAENFSKIFAQGFSTRPDGHGFGLHSSLLAAQEMGGSLAVQSNGPGQGAVFTLELAIAQLSKPCPPQS